MPSSWAKLGMVDNSMENLLISQVEYVKTMKGKLSQKTPYRSKCDLPSAFTDWVEGTITTRLPKWLGWGFNCMYNHTRSRQSTGWKLWACAISRHMPKSEGEFEEKILEMEAHWQFPWCWGALDRCHIPIKCPAVRQESLKEYHNFKNFYSDILHVLVDSHYKFVQGSCDFKEILINSLFFNRQICGKILMTVAFQILGKWIVT